MPRRAHQLTPAEATRIVLEHLLAVGSLFVGLVVGAFVRDPAIPSLLDVSAWLETGAASRFLSEFVDGLGRFRPLLPALLAWNVTAAGCLQYAMYLNGLYDRQPVRRRRLLFFRLVRAAVLAGIVVSVLSFLVRPAPVGRGALAVGFALTVGLVWSSRALRRSLESEEPERVLLLGGGLPCRVAVEATLAADAPRRRVIGRLGEPDRCCADVPLLGDWSDIDDVLEERDVDRLLVASPPPPGWSLDAIVAARMQGVAVSSASEYAEGLTGEVSEEELGAEFITESTSRPYGRISRLVDTILSATLLVALLPVLALVGLAVLVTSGRPVLFRQERVGRGGRRFTQVKFRTMRTDAEREGPSWSPPGDERVTPLGRFLRRWRIDELPNLWNVLRGDMAFVGPRPEQPFFVEKLGREIPSYDVRHVVRPGITGWAQVRAPYGATTEDARLKLRYDLFYIKHRSPYLDLVVLFDTVRVVLLGRGR